MWRITSINKLVRVSVIGVQDGELGIASLLQVDTLHNLRACRFALKIGTVQVSCRQPSSVQHVAYVSGKKEKKHHTEVLLTRCFSCEPEISKGCAQVSEVLRREAPRPGAVASTIKRVAEPAREEKGCRLRDGRLREHRS